MVILLTGEKVGFESCSGFQSICEFSEREKAMTEETKKTLTQMTACAG